MNKSLIHLKRKLHSYQGLAVSLIFLLANTAIAQNGQQRQNVLFIIIDDLRPIIGAYNNLLVQTPNIDQLAASGFVFENAFATVPVCGASRAALLSGRKPTTNRFLTYSSRLDEDLPDAPNIPGYFKAHDYYTLANGKVFDNFTDSEESWSEPVWGPTGSWTSSIPADNRGEHLQKAYQDNPEGVTGPAFERLDVTDSSYPDGKIADKTVADLQRLSNSEAPFFLTMGIRKPHLPFNVPASYWDLYKPDDFVLPTTYFERPASIPSDPFHAWGELRQYAGIPKTGPLSDAAAKNLIHGYHAAVSYADAQVGKVLDALENENLKHNTIVILIGDHGFNLGEHTMWTKHTLFDLALHSPMIIRAPNHSSGRISGITDFLDIFPTLIELTGLPKIPSLDGVSLVPALNDVSTNVKNAAISRWFNGTSVRTTRHRYTEWRAESGEVTARMLFDIVSDPEETINIAELQVNADLVRELSTLITRDDSNSPWAPMLRERFGPTDSNLSPQ